MQARLRAEYDRMEDKLREMEEQMRARETLEARNRQQPEGEAEMEPEIPSGGGERIVDVPGRRGYRPPIQKHKPGNVSKKGLPHSTLL